MSTVTQLVEKPAKPWVGESLKRKEDFRLLTGLGKFCDDIKISGMGHAALLLSPYPHARILEINSAEAEKLPGVICTLTGDEVAKLTVPFFQFSSPPAKSLKDYCMAVGEARYVGEPVAAVVAETRAIAEDALQLIEVSYEILDHVLDGRKALAPDAPLVHREIGTNLVFYGKWDYGDIDQAIGKADKVVKRSLHFHRFSSTPIETTVVVANYDKGTGILTINCNHQMPGMHYGYFSPTLKIPSNKIRIIAGDVGGAFGNKINNYPHMVLVSLLAIKSGRPVKWVEERSEHLLTASHGNERDFDVEIPVERDGTILGMKVTAWDNCGAHTRTEPQGAKIWAKIATGCYNFRNFRMDFYQTLSNKAPVGPNRGYSRMQHMWVVERSIEEVARELGLDSSEVRFKNFVQSREMPYVTVSGAIYDGGDYAESLRRALKLANYSKWRAKQIESRETKKVIGIGLATGIQPGAPNYGEGKIPPLEGISGNSEGALISIDSMGQITVAMGTLPTGQGHETFASQIVADELGVAPDKILVLPGFDTAFTPHTPFSGAYASRCAVSGTGALLGAAAKIKQKAALVAAYLMRTSESKIEFRDGYAIDRDNRKKISLQQIAHVAWKNYSVLPEGMEPGLTAVNYWRSPYSFPKIPGGIVEELTFAYHSHVAVIEMDTETGKFQILDYFIVDDCGKQINPMIVEGQVHGAAAHGIGGAMYENFEYDESGQLRSSTFVDYLVPTSLEIPHLTTASIETLSLSAPLGVRGMGEGGGTPLAAISNAVQDALSFLGVTTTDSHQNPYLIYGLIKAKEKNAAR